MISAAAWLLIWQAAAFSIGKELLLPGPAVVLRALLGLVGAPLFWGDVLRSLSIIVCGWALGCAVAAVLALLVCLFPPIEPLFGLPIRAASTAPIASFTLLLLLWAPSAIIAFPISFLMALPVVYTAFLTGLNGTSNDFVEAAEDFGASKLQLLFWVRCPLAIPFFKLGCQTAMGLCWKAGIAAEIIGIASKTLGGRIYNAKLTLETAEMFAVTLMVIVVSSLLERMIFLRRF